MLVWLGWVGESAPRVLRHSSSQAPTVIKVLVAGYSAARPEEKASN